ncbi:MAG: AAA family ATPase [Myxococcota bacterium]|nr:AAA family ATPase [Myxococcota bacterium]
MTPLTNTEKTRLRAHYGFKKMPFSKYLKVTDMYDSQSQKELREGLEMWLDVGGIALISGPCGVGKSMTLRRFAGSLDNNKYAVYTIPSPTATVHGFLRLLCRRFGLDVKHYTVDLFHAAQSFLVGHKQERGTHPILIVDDAEGLYPDVADVLRRLTVYDLDAEDRFSLLVSGIENLLQVLELGLLAPLHSRFSFGHTLRPFGLEDTRSFIRFHLRRSGGDETLFSDQTVKRIFHLSQGRPRAINQLCIGAIILGAVRGKDRIDGAFFNAFIADHPLYQNQGVTQ